MRASTVRTCAAAAAVPAALVVIAHLAYVWHQHPSSADRQTTAFTHGIGLAAILAAVLAAGDRAVARGRARHVLAGVVAMVGTIAVLAHLADDWRDGRRRSSLVALLHAARWAALAVGARPGQPAGSRPRRRRAAGPTRSRQIPGQLAGRITPGMIGLSATGAARGRRRSGRGRERPSRSGEPPDRPLTRPPSAGGRRAGAEQHLIDLDRAERRPDLPPRCGRRRRCDRHVPRSAIRSTRSPRQTERTRALGSGFVIDRHGHILTNAHVVAGASIGDGRLPQGRHLQRHGRSASTGSTTSPSSTCRRRRARCSTRCRSGACARCRSATRWSRSGTRSASTAASPRASSRPSGARSTRSSPATRSTTRSRPTPRSTTATPAAR